MKHIAWTLSAALSLSAASQTLACAFHGYTPDPTVVDILLGTEQVIVAKPDPENPARYVPVDALLGPQDITIPIPVSVEIKEALAATDTVLLEREEAYGPWLELAVLDDDYRSVVEKVMSRQSDWIYGGDDERFQMFAELVNHENEGLRRLALRELDRADYSVLHALHIPLVATLEADLHVDDDDLRPIRILLAGLSGDPRFNDIIWEGLARAVALDLPYMGAYVTAMIELNGPQAVQRIVEAHGLKTNLSADAHERLFEAFAIKNQTADGLTQRAVESGVAQVLDVSPSLAAAAARQFGFRGDWSLTASIRRANQTQPPDDVEDQFAIEQYVTLAEQAGAFR